MKKAICINLIILIFSNTLFSQNKNAITPLTIGDMMPNIRFSNLINYGSSEIKLAGLKGRVVILDFWSTRCAACIQLFPHMNELQKQFGDKLQIILVNTKSKLYGDDRPKIERLFARLRQHMGLDNRLPIVFSCDSLDGYFPCRILPHEIWLDRTGKVAGITSEREVTPDNIKKMIDGATVDMRRKRDVLDDDEKSLENQSNGPALYRSAITGYREGFGHSKSVKIENGHTMKIAVYNSALIDLCMFAYPDINVPYNQIVPDVRDTTRFRSYGDNPDPYGNVYCYELEAPAGNLQQARKYMQEDLKRAFNVTVKQEKRIMPCYVIKATDSISKSLSKGGQPNSDLVKTTLHKYITNEPVEKIINLFTTFRFFDRPLVNGTGFTGNLDLELPYDLSNRTALLKTLNSAGLALEAGQQEIDVMVISDR